MARKAVALVACVLLIGSVLPTALGRHFSVGGRDSIGTQASETPEDPSVGEENYKIGTQTDCYEPDGNLTQEEAEETMASDEFCGELVYHSGNAELRHTSAPDQDLRTTSQVDIGTFDVVGTNVVDVDFFFCTPFCESDPGGDITWDAVHTAGEAAGVTEGPEETDKGHDGESGTAGDQGTARDYGQGISFHFPTASYVVQQNTDAWEMNGWWSPAFTAKNWVAYLYDDEGQPIGDDRLATIVSNLKASGELPSDAKDIVCGWTPDFQFSSLNFEGSSCEIKFEYREPGTSTGEADFKAEEDYNDPCESPAWVCGAFSGAAWYSRAWYPTGAQFGMSTSPNEGVFDYLRWHFFVAGHPSECGGTQEPGYSFDADEAGHPYLAHELEVFTKPTDVRSSETVESAANLQDYAYEGYDKQTDEAVSELDDTLPGIPDGTLPDEDPTSDPYPTQIDKDSRVEPNADPVGSLGETSQSLSDDSALQRSLGDFCQEFLSNEDSDTVDPWVDLVDGEVDTETQGHSVGAFGVGTSTEGVAYYGNADQNQDDENQGASDLYRTDGNVGMFTDKNDDGDYDTLSGNPTVLSSRSHVSLSGDKYDVNNIQNAGAYPMLWDMWVTEDETGELVVDEGGGCPDIADQPFASEMKAAGYGAETALFQAVYLNEPTTFAYSDTGEAVPYSEGDNIYLFLSQSARAHYDADTVNANDVDEQIDDVVGELKASVSSSADVKIPGDEFGLDSDYMNQCFEDTGGFTLEFGFTHQCVTDCSGDTIVTGYTFEVTRADGTLGGQTTQTVPIFEVGGDAYDFGTGQHTWVDVDPFDNDPERQDDTDSSPPS